MSITHSERAELAELLGINDQYLYQCLTGLRSLRADEAMRAERDSGGRIKRWDVRIHDWHLIWPELVGTTGAPVVPDHAT